MTDRKQTPDLLAEMLGGELSTGIDDVQVEEKAPKKRRTSRTRRPRPSSKRWEYLLVSFQEYRGWRPRFVNGEELDDWMDGPIIHDYIQNKGDEGWELASTSAGTRMYSKADKVQVFFKRAK